ncbi:hypothetical protein, partial [Glycomyces tenuis]
MTEDSKRFEAAARLRRRTVLTSATAAIMGGAIGVGPGPAQAAPPETYWFRNVEIGGGGFVPGIVFNEGQRDIVYA